MRQNGNITVYGRKKNWEGGNYEDGIQQKTEKSISHSSSHGGRVLKFPVSAATCVPVSGGLPDDTLSPPVCGIS